MRGATFSFALPIVLPLAFQSTHPRGVRRKAGIEVKHEIYFNPRTSEGCDCSRARAFPSCRHFNPRTPCGVRPGIGSGLTELVEFQSTHPMRGATCPCAIFARPCRDFNPRTPCGVRLSGRYRRQRAASFQSTHPRWVRHTRARGNLCRDDISIHAPARGATDIDDITDGDGTLFQSTHPRGVRPFVFALTAEVGHFNPRTREGCDALSTGTRFST